MVDDMMMPEYFMIYPKSGLLSVLKDSDADLREILSTSVLWTDEFADKGLLQGNDFEVLIKGLFLAQIFELVGVKALFHKAHGGDIPVTVDFFDRYWTIVRIVDAYTVKPAVRELAGRSELREFLSSVDNKFSEYVEAIKQKPLR